MGKRELLLIAAFVVLGAVVYHATAPPGKPGETGFSLGKLFNFIRAEVHGENSQVAVTREVREALPAEVSRLVLPDYRGTLSLIGEDRSDVAAELQATAYGIDDSVAQTRARAVTLKLDVSGDQVVVKMPTFEEGRRPTFKLTLKVPARLACSLGFRGEAEARGVEEVRLLSVRGRLVVQDVGRLTGDMRDGGIEALRVREVQLTTDRTDVRLERITGALNLEAEHGQVHVRRVGGPVTLRLNRLDCELEGLDGPTRIEMEHGRLDVRGIVAPLEVAAARTRVELAMAKAVAISAGTKFDELAVHLPDDGVTIDAQSDHGQIRVSDRTIEVEEHEGRQRANGVIGKGGPTVRLRNERGDIVIR